MKKTMETKSATKHETVERTCEMCGKTFFAKLVRVKAGGGRFCSSACSGKLGFRVRWAGVDRSGKNNPNYKNGAGSNSHIEHEVRKRNHPEKVAAGYVYREALKTGKLKRQPCEVCGETKVDGHHEDYSKPLEVRWLCRKHHNEIHHGKKQQATSKR
jgi:hypothetical protein